MNLCVRGAVCALMMLVSSTASAGLIGSAYLNVENLVIRDGSGVITATFWNEPAPAIRTTSATTVATNEASLEAGFDAQAGGGVVQQLNASNVIAPPLVAPGIPLPQAPPAIVGAPPNGFASSSTFGGAFADFSGDPMGGIAPTGANAESIATFEINDAYSGSAISNLTTTTQFVFQSATDTTAEITFDAEMLLTLANTGVGNSYDGFASSEFDITVSGTGTDGSPFTQVFAPSELNDTLNGIGTKGTGGSIGFTSDPIELISGNFYTVTINQTVSVRATQVPEPGTMAIFACIGLMGVGASRRRRRVA